MALRDVLAAVDPDHGTGAVLAAAADIVRSSGGQLHVLYVHELPDNVSPDVVRNPGAHPVSSQRLADEAQAEVARLKPAARQLRADGLAVSLHAAYGDAAEAIVRVGDEIGVDCIVIGTHGRGGLLRVVLGSVAEAVVRTSKVPVLVVPARPGADRSPFAHTPVSLD